MSDGEDGFHCGKVKDKRQKTKDKRQKTKGKRQKTKDKRLKIKDKRQKAKDKRKIMVFAARIEPKKDWLFF